jgi:hypothetical protein
MYSFTINIEHQAAGFASLCIALLGSRRAAFGSDQFGAPGCAVTSRRRHSCANRGRRCQYDDGILGSHGVSNADAYGCINIAGCDV